jgi:hypothetical protein
MTSVPDNGVMLSTGTTSLFLSLQMINLFYNSLLCGNRHLYKLLRSHICTEENKLLLSCNFHKVKSYSKL